MAKFEKPIDSKYVIEVDGLTPSSLVIVKIKNRFNGNIIPDDEPMFLFRAKDIMTLKVLVEYHTMCSRHGCTAEHLESLSKTIHNWAKWQGENKDKLKEPGSTMPQDLKKFVECGNKVVTPEVNTVGKKKLLDKPDF